MTNLSKSFVFYMKNLDTMDDLNGFGDKGKDEINALFEGSGLKNASDMIDLVTEVANQTAANILLKIGKAVDEKYSFKMISRFNKIKENWFVENWMYKKKPETGNGYVLSIQICSKGDTTEGIGFLSCSICDSRKKDTVLLEKIFSENIKEGYDDDIFGKDEWLILETVILEEDSEEKIIEDFMVKLSEILTQDNLAKLFAVN